MTTDDDAYRRTMEESLFARSDYYLQQWRQVHASGTPWWATETPESHHFDVVDTSQTNSYHFDQANIAQIIKYWSQESPATPHGPSHDYLRRILPVFRDVYVHDPQSCDAQALNEILLFGMSILDYSFFQNVFMAPLLLEEALTGGPGRTLRLVALEVNLGPRADNDRYSDYDEARNTIVIYASDKQGRRFNTDRLLGALAHEMVHVFLHVFAYEVHPVDRAARYRIPHGPSFWVSLEFIYYKMWKAIPDSDVFTYLAAWARQKRRRTEGDTEVGLYGLAQPFQEGQVCVQDGVTDEMVADWNVARINATSPNLHLSSS
ncbi:hypothetical protein SUNI508_07221 [Seiridium unicorne]|uniref:SprT-like domain-containing protein n=1 Tax=Seiridium unicorne TaxID=138068 RepID=A0ABR2UYL1_9PEZI